MDVEEYLAHFGQALTDAEQRYVRAFGVPAAFAGGPGRNPYTSGVRITDAPAEADELDRRERQDAADEEDAAFSGALDE